MVINKSILEGLIKERKEFENQLPELLLKYKNQYIAMYCGRVISYGCDPHEVKRNARELPEIREEANRTGCKPPILIVKVEEGTTSKLKATREPSALHTWKEV